MQISVKCDFSHVTFDLTCRTNRSFANATSGYDIPTRHFNILAVEYDVKRFHMAVDTPKSAFYLPNPVTFFLVAFDF